MPYLRAKEVGLFYEMAGHGLPVLLIHGVGVPGSGWGPQVRGLKDRCELLTYDNRGVGRSIPCRGTMSIEAMARDARRLLDDAGWKSAHVVGHSLGGVIAQQLALTNPDRVRSLVLACTFHRGKDGARVTPWVLWMSLRTRIGTLRMRRRAFLQMLFTEEYLLERRPEALASEMSVFLGRDLAVQPPVMMRQLQALRRSDLSGRLAELKDIPALVMGAEKDLIAPLAQGRKLASAIPGSVFEQIANASHGAMIQKADWVNERLFRFFQGVEQQRTVAQNRIELREPKLEHWRMMKAVILAAGKGTRMKDLTQEVPKPMLGVEGRPILEHILEGLKTAGIREVFIVTGWHAEVIENHFGDGGSLGLRIQYGRQTVQNGTGKAPELAKAFVGGDPFLLTYGDILVKPETYGRMVERFGEAAFSGLVTVTGSEDVTQGGLNFFDEDFCLTRLVEKPTPEQIQALREEGMLKPGDTAWYNAGIYIFQPMLFEFTARLKKSPRGEYELTDAINGLVGAGHRVAGLKIEGRWVDVRDPEVLASLQSLNG